MLVGADVAPVLESCKANVEFALPRMEARIASVPYQALQNEPSGHLIQDRNCLDREREEDTKAHEDALSAISDASRGGPGLSKLGKSETPRAHVLVIFWVLV